MNGTSPQDRELKLGPYVDGELMPDERRQLEQEMNSADRGEIARSERLKALVRYAYADERPPQRPSVPRPRRHKVTAVAAVLAVFALGLVLGRETWRPQEPLMRTLAEQPHRDRVILYLGRNGDQHFRDVLARTEKLLSRFDARALKVEVVANAGGLDLLRADVSPFVREIRDLARRYRGRVQFVACNNTIANLESKGTHVILIDEVNVAPAAVEHIVNRLNEGWMYYKI